MTSAWGAALDAIEFNLTATETALTAGVAPPVSTPVTVPSEPLPEDLATRAQALAALTQRLEIQAAAGLERLREGLRGLPARRVSTPAASTGNVVDIGA